MTGVRGVLFDVDGTLLDKDRPIPGAAEVVDRLRARGIPFRIGTNTTRRPRSAIAAILRRGGIRVEDGEVIAPAVLARRRILHSGRIRAELLVPSASREDFAGVEEGDRPDWVVVGDLGRDFTFERLNRALRYLRSGAGLIALHKNRIWDNGVDGIVLDAGPFVTALEFATGVEAEVVGKPARAFFELALGELGLPAGETLVVGNDIDADGRGGAAAGCKTALVLTGGTTRADLEGSGFRPDRVYASVADLAVPD
ncbi:MAG TPA: HAD-IIA family hydrolase [Candidatus Dormibacteraeota bacterium]|nr:HAD-IIA family hydrolase [Candidatus Dormibacteraeota bacterium]